MLLLFFRQRSPRRNAMPFLQAATATASCRVLRDKDRMTAKRSLPAVIGNDSRCQSWSDEILRVLQHKWQAFVAQVIEILSAQLEAPAEFRFRQRDKKLVQVSHAFRESICSRPSSCGTPCRDALVQLLSADSAARCLFSPGGFAQYRTIPVQWFPNPSGWTCS
jgi:hypothetical protein